MLRVLSCAAVAGALSLGTVAHAADGDDIAKQLRNSPNPLSWQVSAPQKRKTIKDDGVQGGTAVEVAVAAKAANPWDISASNTITGKIAKGDKIVTVVWLKAAGADGQPVSLPLRIQVNAAPYTALGEKTVTVGKTWDKYEFDATADKDYGAKGTVLQVHLGGAAQTVDLGPAFVLDMGPG